MGAIITGTLFIVVGLFHLRELKNKNSWWVWTNWQARGFRDYMGDDGYETYMRVANTLLIALGVFFIFDQTLSSQMISEWIASKRGS